ncbi:hypothetical protein [Brevundimonas sp. NPDC046655]|uniref:hypothetical protein n=1 Tax=unclassified Brevundimonas TaxID=2622653 RepID=UPI00384F41F0
MKTVSLVAVLSIAAPLAAHAQSQTAEELTRLLNGAPPAAARLVPSPAPAPAPSAAPTANAPVRPAPAPAPRSVQAAPTSPETTPARRSSSATAAPTIAAPARAASAPAPRPAPAPTTVVPARAADAATPVVPARASAPGAAPAPVAPAAPAPRALSAAAVAALPFRIDLPSGFQLFEGRGAPDSHVYSVRRAGKTFAMIYTGSSSQFPIYDGEQVTAAGRVSVVVPEGTRRIAMEHLFQQPTAPNEIHVWLMSLEGADRDAAERIAQSLDPK